jgi:uncharacterized NAD(P)/FAD-binding protein YdhS/quercetin dioxygenase-like cupin family protein
MDLSPALDDIARDLAARTQHTSATLAAALRRPVGIDDVVRWIRFDPARYVRSLVARGEGWELRLLCFRPGQSTAVHAHGSAACAFRILRGSATETILGSRDRVRAPGDVVEETGPDLVHQVANAGSDPLLSLHAYSPPLPVDAPAPIGGRNVVVVGGGLSGVAAAIHLLRRGDADLRVTLVERGPWIGRGVAYGVDSEVFRLNVPASRMSLDPERPGDFVAWAGAEADPAAFLSRARYGAYVVARLAEAVRSSRAKLRVVRGDAVEVDERSVRLASGASLPAEIVVLATGIAPRLAPSSLPDDPRILDAWDEVAMAALPHDGRILILGSGLTAVDVVTWLATHGFRGRATILSRRGLLPRPHLSPPGAGAPISDDEAAAAPRDLRGLLSWGRAIVRDRVRRGEPWQRGIDALRPHVARLYRGLPPEDRARFARSVRPYWDVLRHRAPADALAVVDAWRAEGRVEVLAGRVASCDPSPDGLRIGLDLAAAPARTERYDCVVRCIGPALERSEAEAPVLRALVTSGLATADPSGLGLVTDGIGRVIDASGAPSERIFALGAPRRASAWETTSVPDISVHALALARHVVP